ncbi:MAG: DUF2442 domain-containing protein [Cyclobacteriaceae bacterium]|nr:DUF2442 domain-containing protein [Cyclobacteriaceae bacterium]
MNPRVEKVKYVDHHILEILFVNGESKLFDASPYLNFPIYQQLQDQGFFRKAKAANGTVVWDDFTDFDPDLLYLESVKK